MDLFDSLWVFRDPDGGGCRLLGYVIASSSEGMKESGLQEGEQEPLKQACKLKASIQDLFCLSFFRSILYGVIPTTTRLASNAFSHHIGPVHPSPPFRTSLKPHPRSHPPKQDPHTQSLKSLPPRLERPHLREQRAQRRLLVLRVGRPQQPPGGGRGQGPVKGAAEGLFRLVGRSMCEGCCRRVQSDDLNTPSIRIINRPHTPTTHPRTSFVSPNRRLAARLLAAAFALLAFPCPCSIAATTAWARRSRASV